MTLGQTAPSRPPFIFPLQAEAQVITRANASMVKRDLGCLEALSLASGGWNNAASSSGIHKAGSQEYFSKSCSLMVLHGYATTIVSKSWTERIPYLGSPNRPPGPMPSERKLGLAPPSTVYATSASELTDKCHHNCQGRLEHPRGLSTKEYSCTGHLPSPGCRDSVSWDLLSCHTTS